MGSNTVHAYPVRDLVDHDTGTDQPDCICGPTVEHVPHAHGPDGWVIVHHSLDGREHHQG